MINGENVRVFYVPVHFDHMLSFTEGRMEYYRISVCWILQEIFREKRA